jgi:cytosine/adenosine deaminase-related metal-dependent hydrolase
MDDAGRVIRDGGFFAEGGCILDVGPSTELPRLADDVIDASDMLVMPGMVNTHHHLYQTLTRAVPQAQNATLFDWLRTLYPIWAGITPEAVHASALTGIAELLLSGCTTTADHLYIFPNDCRLDDEIRAAHELGIRFHATRGAMSLGESEGGLPPDAVVESEETILADMRRVVETYHDSAPRSMLRIAIAPCSPFSVTPDLMRESAALARAYGVRMHTHLAETLDEQAFCLGKFGMRPAAYAEHLAWVGDDVWHVHCVHLDEREIALFAATGTAVSHAPSSNMRLGSGVAPVRELLDAGCTVGLGVDGSASNDSSHMLAEARQALLLQRVLKGPGALSASETLWAATRGGAAVLGRDDIGQLAPGMAADAIGLRLDRLDYAGALQDPIATLVFCHPQRVDWSVVNGRVVVREGVLQTGEIGAIAENHNRISRELLAQAL